MLGVLNQTPCPSRTLAPTPLLLAGLWCILHAAPAQARPDRVALFPTGEAALDRALGEAAQKSRPQAKILDAAAVQSITTRIGAAGLEAVRGCTEVACATELGGALGVDEVLLCSSESGEGETDLSLTLMRIDVRRGRILAQGNRKGALTGLLAGLMQEVLGTAKPPGVEAEVHVVTREAERSFEVRSRGDDPQQCALTTETPCVIYLPTSASTLRLRTEGYPAASLDLTPKSGVSTYAVRTTGNSGLFTASVFGSIVGAGMMIGGSVDLARGIEPAVPAVSLSLGTVLLAAAVYGLYSMYPSVESVPQE